MGAALRPVLWATELTESERRKQFLDLAVLGPIVELDSNHLEQFAASLVVTGLAKRWFGSNDGFGVCAPWVFRKGGTSRYRSFIDVHGPFVETSPSDQGVTNQDSPRRCPLGRPEISWRVRAFEAPAASSPAQQLMTSMPASKRLRSRSSLLMTLALCRWAAITTVASITSLVPA